MAYDPDAPRVAGGLTGVACVLSPFACARQYAGEVAGDLAGSAAGGVSSVSSSYESAVRATGEAAAEPLREIGTISIAVAVGLGFLAMIVLALVVWYFFR